MCTTAHDGGLVVESYTKTSFYEFKVVSLRLSMLYYCMGGSMSWEGEIFKLW